MRHAALRLSAARAYAPLRIEAISSRRAMLRARVIHTRGTCRKTRVVRVACAPSCDDVDYFFRHAAGCYAFLHASLFATLFARCRQPAAAAGFSALCALSPPVEYAAASYVDYFSVTLRCLRLIVMPRYFHAAAELTMMMMTCFHEMPQDAAMPLLMLPAPPPDC